MSCRTDPGRSRPGRRWPGVAALAALAVAVVGAALPVEPASASRLDVRAEPAAIVTRSACTSTAVEVVPTTTTAPTAVRLDGLTAIDAAACAGQDVQVTLFDASGVVGTAEGTLTGTAHTYALAGSVVPSQVTRARVLVGGFAIPATWRLPGPPPDSCQVLYLDGSPSGIPCTITRSVPGGWWGSPGYGYGQWTFYAHADVPADLGDDTYIAFEVTVPEHAAIPAWWSWDGAVVSAVNNSGQVTSSCSELPTVRGRLGDNIGGDVNIFLEFRDSGTGVPNVLCRP